MDKLQLIQNRRREVDQEIGRLEALLAALRTEAEELDTAERVLARLGGASRGAASPSNGYKATTPIGKVLQDAGTEPTAPEMIVAVLLSAQKEGLKNLTSREIADRMKAEFKRDDLNDERISSTIWRLWKADRLRKIRQGVYALPKEKPASDKPVEGAPAGLDDNPAQGGEARPGGGT